MADAKSSETGKTKSNGAKAKRAPTLYFIIVSKLTKGVLLLLLGLEVYHIRDRHLPDEFNRLIEFLRLNPEGQFYHDLAEKIDQITPANIRLFWTGSLLYSLSALVEGIGLIFRMPWAGWLAIGESAFFIPIEISHIMRTGFSWDSNWKVWCILCLNVFIVWYLFQNRKRLFRH